MGRLGERAHSRIPTNYGGLKKDGPTAVHLRKNPV